MKPLHPEGPLRTIIKLWMEDSASFNAITAYTAEPVNCALIAARRLNDASWGEEARISARTASQNLHPLKSENRYTVILSGKERKKEA